MTTTGDEINEINDNSDQSILKYTHAENMNGVNGHVLNHLKITQWTN
mgnify:FL=1